MSRIDKDIARALLDAYGIDSERVKCAHFQFHAEMPTRITVEYVGCKLENGVKLPHETKTFDVVER